MQGSTSAEEKERRKGGFRRFLQSKKDKDVERETRPTGSTVNTDSSRTTGNTTTTSNDTSRTTGDTLNPDSTRPTQTRPTDIRQNTDSAYASSENDPTRKTTPDFVQVENHDIAGVGHDRNLWLDKNNGEIYDEDTGDIV